MKVVVSDTSPIRALANLALLDILRDLYGEVIVPTAVARELANPPRGQPAVQLTGLPFVRVQAPSDAEGVARLSEDLDAGESEALALAAEIHADLVLMDETAGRARARAMGLETVGVLGVLLEARRMGLIGPLSPLLDRLRGDYGFFVSDRLRSRILRLAGEVG